MLSCTSVPPRLSELIDTLWNVNSGIPAEVYNCRCELIDTLWNVNVYLFICSACFFGINRYIMECKSATEELETKKKIELIDTLWNVNSKLTCHSSSPFFELIDTLWNVNLKGFETVSPYPAN